MKLVAQAVAPEPSAPVARSPRARRPARQRNTTNSTVYRERYGKVEHAKSGDDYDETNRVEEEDWDKMD